MSVTISPQSQSLFFFAVFSASLSHRRPLSLLTDGEEDGDGAGADDEPLPDDAHAEYDGAEATQIYRKTALDVLTGNDNDTHV